MDTSCDHLLWPSKSEVDRRWIESGPEVNQMKKLECKGSTSARRLQPCDFYISKLKHQNLLCHLLLKWRFGYITLLHNKFSYWLFHRYYFIYIYIRVMSVLPVWIPACLPASGTKPTSRPRPWACDTSLEPSRQTKLIHEKIPRFARTVRPPGAKTCSVHYISYLKTTV